MVDMRISKLARVLVRHSTRLRRGERVLILADVGAASAACEVLREALGAGALADVELRTQDLDYVLHAEGSDEQLGDVSPIRRLPFDTYPAFIQLHAPANTRHLNGVPPARLACRAKAIGPLMQTMLERSARGEMKWVGAAFPTAALAQEAGMSLAEYEEFFSAACRLDDDDPVAAWGRVRNEQERIVGRLQQATELHITAPDTDLRARVAGRKWVNCCGEYNLPDGEVFTTPLEDSVEGHIRFSFPGIFHGAEIEDIRLVFRKGRVVEATAARGADLLQALLDTDEGARRVGELAVGTNHGIKKFTRNMLFDEKIGGTIHLAVGAAPPHSGGVNRSAIHWDMLCDMRSGGRILADGAPIYEAGRFLF